MITLKEFDTARVLMEVYQERCNQDVKWGTQNHPILSTEHIDDPILLRGRHFISLSSETIKSVVDRLSEEGGLTYFDILMEEIAEAVECGSNEVELREELIQCAAVIVAMIERIDRNNK